MGFQEVKSKMTVALCVVALNEENFLPNLLKDLSLQTYEHKLTEIILVDSMSDDGTKQIMKDFASSAHDFRQVRVFENPKKIQSAGWNVAIKNAESDVIIRIDAHTHIPIDFTEKNMQLQEQGEFVTGGIRPCLVENSNKWKENLLSVENSLFGSSIGASRKKRKTGYVKTMFHAAYRKEVFEKVGYFNENLLRTEDNEMHYRIRQAGYKLYCDSDIISYQYARSSFEKMMKQKYANGYWIGKTAWFCPKCLSLYHFVPVCFFLGIILTTILACFSFWHLAALMWSTYFLFSILGIITTIINGKANHWIFLMPIMFLVLHVSYGIGTIKGFFSKRIGR